MNDLKKIINDSSKIYCFGERVFVIDTDRIKREISSHLNFDSENQMIRQWADDSGINEDRMRKYANGSLPLSSEDAFKIAHNFPGQHKILIEIEVHEPLFIIRSDNNNSVRIITRSNYTEFHKFFNAKGTIMKNNSAIKIFYGWKELVKARVAEFTDFSECSIVNLIEKPLTISGVVDTMKSIKLSVTKRDIITMICELVLCLMCICTSFLLFLRAFPFISDPVREFVFFFPMSINWLHVYLCGELEADNKHVFLILAVIVYIAMILLHVPSKWAILFALHSCSYMFVAALLMRWYYRQYDEITPISGEEF